jgi:hypothetical protein
MCDDWQQPVSVNVIAMCVDVARQYDRDYTYAALGGVVDAAPFKRLAVRERVVQLMAARFAGRDDDEIARDAVSEVIGDRVLQTDAGRCLRNLLFAAPIEVCDDVVVVVVVVLSRT